MTILTFKQRDTVVDLVFPFNREINGIIKTTDGWAFNPETKTWSIPVRQVEKFIEKLDAKGYAYDREGVKSLSFCRLSHNEIKRLLAEGRAAVFDIETWEPQLNPNGKVDPLRHRIVCASIAFAQDGNNGAWDVRQWFAHSPDKEAEVLQQVGEFLARFELIVTYNGDSFDLPCTNNRMRAHGLSCLLDPARHFDLLPLALQWKSKGYIPSARLTMVEKAVGINRQDDLPGAAVVGLYKEYINGNPDPKIPEAILLHNKEDVLYLGRDIAPKLLGGDKIALQPVIENGKQSEIERLAEKYAELDRLRKNIEQDLRVVREQLLQHVKTSGSIQGSTAVLSIAYEERVDRTAAESYLKKAGLLDQYTQQVPSLDIEKIKNNVKLGKLPKNILAKQPRITVTNNK